MPLHSFLTRTDPDSHRVIRGHGVIDAKDAARFAGSGPTFPMVGVSIPEPLRYRTIAIQGHQGTGKSLTILQLILAALLRMKDPQSRERLIVVDCKGDLTSTILGMVRVLCPGIPTYLLSPFDRLGYSLDPHEFVNDPTQIVRLVSSLTYRKRDGRTDEFFDNSARSYLVLLVKILQRSIPGRWTWRDFYHLATNYKLLANLMKNTKMGEGKAGPKVQKTFAGVVMTIDSWLAPFECTFAGWQRSPAIPFKEFLRGRGIAILSAPEDQREVLSPFARTLLRGAKDRLLTDAGRDSRSKTTIVLDEFADLDELVPVIMPFFGKSRSAQVSLICAWQSWPAVCLSHGEAPMRAVLDNAGVKVWMGCGPASAEIASTDCMKAEVERRDVSYGHSPSFSGWTQSSMNVGHRNEMRANVLPAEIQALAYPQAPEFTVRAYVTASHLPGPVYAKASYRTFIDFLNRLPKVPTLRPRPEARLWLPPWDDELDGGLLDAIFEEGV